MSTTRLRAAPASEKTDITVAKGLGITLVVIGHILARGRSEGNDWFVVLKDCIYLFHMAFFMYLSGYVFFRPGRVARLRAQFGEFAQKQSLRLLVPFLVMGISILLLKYFLHAFIHVDNVPQSLLSGLVNLLWTTDQSPSIFIWYVFVLFLFTMLSPTLFYSLLKERMALWVALGFGIYLLPLIPYLYLNKATLYFLFFAIGGYLRQREERYEALLDRHWRLLLLIFLCSFSLKLQPYTGWKFNHLVVGICGIPALHGLCRAWCRNSPFLQGVFYPLGEASYTIYLFNTLAIGAVKAFIFKVSDWHGVNFFWVAPLLILGGVLLPVLAEKWVLMRLPWVRRHILGKPAKG